MGAWGPGEFENDAALDWLGDIGAGEDLLDACREAFQNALDEDYLDSEPGSVAVAAAAVVAAIRDGKRGLVPDEVPISGFTIDTTLVRLALRALEAVGAQESELATLWADAEDSEWRASLDALVKRLG